VKNAEITNPLKGEEPMYAIRASRAEEVFWWDGFTFDGKNVPLTFATKEEANLELPKVFRGRNISNVCIWVVEYPDRQSVEK
jgi:L-ascorbate metabolism protein UlaG (beta-lactamase superfamily)